MGFLSTFFKFAVGALALGAVFKPVRKLLSKVVKNTFFKTALKAAAVYFGGAALGYWGGKGSNLPLIGKGSEFVSKGWDGTWADTPLGSRGFLGQEVFGLEDTTKGGAGDTATADNMFDNNANSLAENQVPNIVNEGGSKFGSKGDPVEDMLNSGGLQSLSNSGDNASAIPVETGVLKGAMNKPQTPVSQQGSSEFGKTNYDQLMPPPKGLLAAESKFGRDTPPPPAHDNDGSKSFFSNNPLVQSAMLTAGASVIPAMLDDSVEEKLKSEKEMYLWKQAQEDENNRIEVPDWSKTDGVVKVAGADSQYGAKPRRSMPYWQKFYSTDPDTFLMKPYGSA
jgi:hypothetical protein